MVRRPTQEASGPLFGTLFGSTLFGTLFGSTLFGTLFAVSRDLPVSSLSQCGLKGSSLIRPIMVWYYVRRYG
jgi:hypothetical protein